jgi:hypothetical protein
MKNGVAKCWKTVIVTGAMALLSGLAWAEIVSTEQALMQAERDRVRSFMQREDVENQLKVLGLPPELARQRTNALTDEEVRVIAGKLDTMPAGSALDKNDWILILLIVILAIVLL